MAVIAQIYQRSDGTRVKRVSVQPQPGQQSAFVNCLATFVAFFAGFGGGKTWAGATKVVKNILGRYRGWDGLIVAPSYGDLETFVMPELMKRLEEVGIKAKYKASSPSGIYYRIRVDGKRKQCKIHLRSGSYPESIAGFQVAWVWIDEAARIPVGKTPTKDVKTQCIARMRGIGLESVQMIITTTHEGDLTWVCEDWLNKPKKDHEHFRSSTFDNRYMKKYARGLVEQYDAKLVQQYVEGHPVNLAGQLVYWAFEEAGWPHGNIDESITLDLSKPVVMSLDFNSNPGMHATIGQYHPERDEFWVVHELHRSGMHVPQLVLEYASMMGEGRRKVITHIYGDPTSHSRDTAQGLSGYYHVRNELMQQKMIMTEKVTKSMIPISDRIISANSAFQDGKGRHIRIHPRCKILIRDLNNVQRDEYGKIDKTQEKLGLVHISDAFTYWVFQKRPIKKINVSDMSFTRSA